MFDLEQASGEIARLPEELQQKLLDVVSTAVNAIERHDSGCSYESATFLDDPESVDFVARYFNDPKYHDVAATYPGLPIRAAVSDEGIVVTVGIRPYKDGVPVDGPRKDGLPYAVSIMSFEAAEEMLLQQDIS